MGPRKAKGAAKMPESEAKKAWKKENTVMIHARLQKGTDADILAYLEGKSVQAEIKKALRYYMARQGDEK